MKLPVGIQKWLQSIGPYLTGLARRLKQSRLGRASLTAAFLLTAFVMSYERYLANSDMLPDMLPVLPLERFERVLVVAPHCDDEVLGAAGVIQAAVRQGSQVRLVIVTNGDGYRFATMEEFRRAFPRSSDFIAMGVRRQQETLNAVAHLGLDARSVTFLGYPDRGLAAMWWSHWNADQAYLSPFSQRSHNPYPNTLNPGVPYNGLALLGDLRNILAVERPDLIITPHPLDDHIDHRALSAFMSLAIAQERSDNPDWSPLVLGYLVHYGLYPQERGLILQDALRPPRRLITMGAWWQWPLGSDALSAKQAAIAAHRSQQRLLGQYLKSFVRQNELFMQLDETASLGLIAGEMLPHANPHIESETTYYGDPVSDSTVRSMYRSADIAGISVFRLNDSLSVVLDLRGQISRACSYRLMARVLSDQGETRWLSQYGRTISDNVQLRGNSLWFKLDLSLVDQPTWLAFAAETRQGMGLDHTAWHVVHLQPALWEGLTLDGK